MTNVSASPTSKSKATPAPAIDALFDMEQNSLEATTRMYTSLLGNAVRVQTEMLRFLSTRFAKDALMLEQFATCRGPSDVAQLQMKLGTDAITDYFAETQRLIGLFEQAAGEPFAKAS